MQTDMIARKKANQLWVIIGVCSLGLSITACDNEMLSGNEKNPGDVELRFDASISDDPSTKANHGASVIEEEAFPNGTHVFGMFITDDAGQPLATGSEDNMKVTLTRGTGVEDDWKYTDKDGGSDIPLSTKHLAMINIIGYYPWVAGATPNAVPFDLTGEASTWTDLMYLASPSPTVQVEDGKAIALQFSHAYCWVTVNLSKLTDKNKVSVSAVSIANTNNALKRVINKGKINPKTGEVLLKESEGGSIVFNTATPLDLPLEGVDSLTFDFLIPEFMATDVRDFEILIQVTAEITSNGTPSGDEILSFPIQRINLNNKANSVPGQRAVFGFEKGKHNTYNLIYNNSEMALSLASWEEVKIQDQTLGKPQQGGRVNITFNKQALGKPPVGVQLDAYNHINHSYLGEVANGNNRDYVDIEPVLTGGIPGCWGPFAYAEPFNPKLTVANKEAAGGGLVPWKDEETGVLRAKQACIDFREGGFTDWRLPRISECYMLVYGKNEPNGIPDLYWDEYWSATERNATDSYYITVDQNSGTPIKVPRVAPKTARMNVRCVRDTKKPKPSI